MIRFAHSEYLYALVLVPLMVALFLAAIRLRRKALERFGAPGILSRLMPESGRYKRQVKFALLAAAVTFLVLGVANPQIGTKLEEVKREGVDIMIALDVSGSMKAQDIKPDRLESAKQEISRLIDKLQNDRIGLILFAGDSYLQLPLTTDYSAAHLLLGTVDVDAVPVPGTAIGSAIDMGMKSFAAGEKKHKVVVIITDGENHEDDAVAAAKRAREDGIVIHTIGMGTPEGAPIPVMQSNVQVDYKKDAGGSVVLTKLDEQALQQIAEAGGGRYIRATNHQDELDIVLKDIQAMEKKEFGARMFTEYEDRFQYFLAIALAFLIAELFIAERRTKWIANLKLFREI